MTSGDPEHDGGPDAEHPLTPEPDPLDVDSAFAAIIAGWADAPTTGSWPAEEDLTVGRHRRIDDDDPRDDATFTPSPPPGGPLLPSLGHPLALGQSSETDETDDDASYVPPDPPPLPRGDIVGWLAWLGVILGPAFMLVVVLGWRSAPEIFIVIALAAFVGGFITLVSRMPKNRDDDTDDGAVV